VKIDSWLTNDVLAVTDLRKLTRYEGYIGGNVENFMIRVRQVYDSSISWGI
jgi:ATP-dependent protease Clp ATPase subunit